MLLPQKSISKNPLKFYDIQKYHSKTSNQIPYIANHSRWKGFVVAKLNCNSLENIHGWTVVLYVQSLLHRLFHWKSFTVTSRSAKTAKLFHLKQFAIYVYGNIPMRM